MMVPAVTEVCLPQWAHSQVHALVCSGQALPAPQAGQTKPSGHIHADRRFQRALMSLPLSCEHTGFDFMLKRIGKRNLFLHCGNVIKVSIYDVELIYILT